MAAPPHTLASTPIDAAVIGGGIAGLALARDLVRAGHRVMLLEARPRAGGVILSERAGRLLIEAGPDSVLAQKPAALELCRELGLADQIVTTSPPRTAFVLRGGTFHALPSDTLLGVPLTDAALDGLTMLSPEGRSRVARDLTAPAPPAHPGRDESVGAFLRRRFGDEMVAAIGQPLLGGIHAGDIDRLSLQALFPRLAKADAKGGSLLRTLRADREPRDPDGAFRGLMGGMGTLVEALAASLPEGTLQTGVTVRRIEAGPPYTVTTSKDGTIRARAVLLCTPAFETAVLIERIDAGLAELCAAIPYVSTATVSLAYPWAAVRHPLDGIGFVVPRGERTTRLLAGSWASSKWPGRADPDTALMRVFAGGLFDEDLLELDDAGLIEAAHRDLSQLLDIAARPQLARVYRWPRASVQYEVGHLDRVAAIDAREAARPGLFLTGSAFRGNGIPDTIADARRTAQRAHDWLSRTG
ncbi:MAG TPA: protoporphyrinogen oxidase [Vicinamibacterales bacterium]